MQRLISLFKELEGDGYPIAGEPERPPNLQGPPPEPVYFVELLKHLREQKAKIDNEKARAARAKHN